MPLSTYTIGTPNAATATTQAQVNANPVPGQNADGTPTNAPVQTPVATPTVGAIYGTDPYSNENQNTAEKASSDFATNGLSADDEAQIRATTIAGFQGEIDAQNNLYAKKLADAQVTGANRLGSTTASEGRRGLIGSDFGAAQTDSVNAGNQSIYDSIGDEKAAALSSINDASTKAVTDALAAKTAAKQAGLDSYVKYLQDGSTRAATGAQTAAQVLLNNKTDPSTLSDADLNNVLSSYGITKDALTSAYAAAQQTATAAAQKTAKDNATTLSPGQVIVDANGKVLASAANNDKYSVVKGATTTDAYGNQVVQPDKVFDTTTGQFVDGAQVANGANVPTSSTDSSTGANIPTTSTTTSTGTGTHNLDFNQYGLLANTDFDPSNQTDSLAAKYLDSYIKNGSVPTASSLGRSLKPAALAQITQRASDLYFKATGQSLPTPQIIKAQQDIIANNYKLGNNLGIQTDTVNGNVNLSLENMTKNGLNSSGFKPLDDLIDTAKDAFQDPAVGQLLSQNATISNEVGSLLAVKNSSGTTVYDKLESAGIIGKNDNPQQIQTKINTLLKEAKIFSTALTSANGAAYKFTDPLLQDANNPARAQYQSSKGTESDNDFVAKSLKSTGKSYNDVIKAVPAGKIGAIDNTTGALLMMDPSDFDSSKYTKL